MNIKKKKHKKCMCFTTISLLLLAYVYLLTHDGILYDNNSTGYVNDFGWIKVTLVPAEPGLTLPKNWIPHPSILSTSPSMLSVSNAK